jgi:hypothetical protein
VLGGKITPTDRERFGMAGGDGTVDPAHGGAKEARKLDERDQASHVAGEHELAAEVSERIRGIISSAEAAANAVRHEAEQRAQSRRRVAEEEAERIVGDARANAEALVAERIRRINELSEGIVERGEAIVSQLDRAEEVRAQLQRMADSLGQTAQELARELGQEAATVRRAEPEPPAEPAVIAQADEPPAEGAEAEAVAEREAEAEEAKTELEVVEVAEDSPGVVDMDDRREPDEQLSARLVALQMAVAGGNRGEVEEHLRRTFEVRDVGGILDDVFGTGTDSDKRVVWPRTAS